MVAATVDALSGDTGVETIVVVAGADLADAGPGAGADTGLAGTDVTGEAVTGADVTGVDVSDMIGADNVSAGMTGNVSPEFAVAGFDVAELAATVGDSGGLATAGVAVLAGVEATGWEATGAEATGVDVVCEETGCELVSVEITLVEFDMMGAASSAVALIETAKQVTHPNTALFIRIRHP